MKKYTNNVMKPEQYLKKKREEKNKRKEKKGKRRNINDRNF